MNSLRCAIYARYSSDRQSPSSIVDQVRKCREYAERQGWQVLDQCIYTDEAVSGTSTERVGLQRMLSASESPFRPFDAILVDDTSRLSRKLADTLNLYERLSFAGIRLVAVSQGVDSAGPQAELLLGVHGLIDAVYWRELGQKTHRGMEGKALKGMATGGRCFGYRTVRGEDGGAVLRVEETEAAIVRQVFELYVSGLSLKRITRKLNSQGVRSPRPQTGRVSRSWCPSSLRHILRNTRYTGKLIWNASRKVRVPGTGKRIKRSRPESERVVVNAPDLRIVTGELFESVQRRFAVVSRLWGRKSGRRGLADCSPRQVYLFSGLLRCGQCGGRISLVSGRGRRGYAKYGCALHHERGVCSNDLMIRRDELERRLLDRLQESVLREEGIDYVVARLEEEITKRFAEFDTELERLRQQKQKAELEIARFVQAIAEGQPSRSLMEAIGEREKELRAISDKLLEPRPGSVRAKLEELRTFAISRLTDLRKLLSHPGTVNEARALLTEHIGKIVLFPVQENGKRSYQARGAVDFFSGQGVAHADGAGGRS